jgi:hypothetical protein
MWATPLPAASLRGLPKDRRHGMARCQQDKLPVLLVVEDWIGANHERVGVLLYRRFKRSIELAFAVHVD